MGKYDDLVAAFGGKVGSLADYVPATLDQFREHMVRRATLTANLLREGKVSRTGDRSPMAYQQKVSRQFCVKIGYGAKNEYVPNPLHGGREVIKCETANEAADVLELGILPLIKRGDIDEGLQTLLERYRRRFRPDVSESDPLAIADYSFREAA